MLRKFEKKVNKSMQFLTRRPYNKVKTDLLIQRKTRQGQKRHWTSPREASINVFNQTEKSSITRAITYTGNPSITPISLGITLYELIKEF